MEKAALLQEELLRTIRGSIAEAEDVNDGWQYAMAFKRLKEEDDELAKTGDVVLMKIFSDDIIDEWKHEKPELWQKLHDGQVKQSELCNLVFEKCKEVLTGKHCGLDVGWQMSVDEDEVFLLVRLTNQETAHLMADNFDIKQPISFAAYGFEGISCLRIDPTMGQRWGFNPKPAPRAPRYLIYNRRRAETFQKERDNTLAQVDDAMAACLQGEHEKALSLARQSRKRIPMMATLLARLKQAELEGKKADYERWKETFDKLNEVIEAFETDDIEEENASMKQITDPGKRFKARTERWGEPRVPPIEQLRSAELYADFDDNFVMRVAWLTICSCINVEKMKEFGISSGFFAMHDEAKLDEFKKGWASIKPQSFLQWPGTQWEENLRGYFGEQVAFFFAWLSMLTRYLIIPALLALIFRLRSFLFSIEWCRTFEFFYSIIIVAWCSVFIAHWKCESQTKSILWDVHNLKAKDSRELPDYLPEMRGSMKESFIRTLHWLFVGACIFETVAVAGELSSYRSDLKSHWASMEGTYIGPIAVSTSGMDTVASYAVTINIRVMNFVWQVVSPRIARRENWRTNLEKKDAQIFKNFLVMCVVYYYPFFYLAFFKPYVEEVDVDTCINELRLNLMTFFVIHIATVVGTMAWSLAMKWWSLRTEQQKAASAAEAGQRQKIFSYVEDLNKREPYSGDEDDYLELMIALGFITMFAVVLPFGAVVGLIACVLELRLQAWRLVWIRQRPVPMKQEGIGAWEKLMPFLCNLAVTSSVALIIFTLEPMHSKWKVKPEKKLLYFIFAERAMFLLVKFVSALMPAESKTDHAIKAQHAEIYARLMMSSNSKEADPTQPKLLQDKSKLVMPGDVIPKGATGLARRVLPVSSET